MPVGHMWSDRQQSRVMKKLCVSSAHLTQYNMVKLFQEAQRPQCLDSQTRTCKVRDLVSIIMISAVSTLHQPRHHSNLMRLSLYAVVWRNVPLCK